METQQKITLQYLQSVYGQIKNKFNVNINKKHEKYDKFTVETFIQNLEIDYKLNKVYVKESAKHGIGVFAKDNINIGEIITLYPAHYVIFYPDGNKHENNHKLGIIKSDLTDNLKYDSDENIKYNYAFDINKYYSICGDPRITNNMNYIGHMINDGCKGHSAKNNYNKKDNELYNKLRFLTCNSIFENIHNLCVCIVATENINKDEEILVSYGYNYWTTHNKMI